MSYNRKIKNATKVFSDGIKYDSKLEMYLAKLLTINKIEYEFQKVYEIQEGFVYGGKKIQNIRIIVDFYLPKYDIIADSKGFCTPEARLKIKMLKFKLYRQGITPKIILLKDRKKCERFINELLAEKQ